MGSIGANRNTALQNATPEQLRNLQTLNADNPNALQQLAEQQNTTNFYDWY